MKVAELIKRDFPGLAASPELLQEISKIGILQTFKKDSFKRS